MSAGVMVDRLTVEELNTLCREPTMDKLRERLVAEIVALRAERDITQRYLVKALCLLEEARVSFPADLP